MKLTHKVQVWGRELQVEVYQRSQFAWVAVGDVLAERLEVIDQTRDAALARWTDAARYRSGQVT